jgi:hypothetical protein
MEGVWARHFARSREVIRSLNLNLDQNSLNL